MVLAENATSGRTYECERHDLIPWDTLAKKEIMSMRQVPNWLRSAMDLTPRFRRGHSLHVPWEVQLALNDVLERVVAGPSRDLQSAGKACMPLLIDIAKSLLETFNEVHEKFCKQTGEAPLLYKKENVTSKWVSRFLLNWQWTWQATNTAGSYLADDSEIMKVTCL